MFARSTTFQASLASIDAGIAYCNNEGMRALEQVEGCAGLSLLVDRESGRCIATSSWQSADAMHASADQVGPIRDRVVQAFGGQVEQIEEWEIAALHRTHNAPEGTCARGSWSQVDAARLDRTVELFKSTAVPGFDKISGFCSASMMVNRQTGRIVVTTAWDDHAALDASREPQKNLRSSILSQVGAQSLDLREFELALAHLRVPELV